jgi:hypothetical protein
MKSEPNKDRIFIIFAYRRAYRLREGVISCGYVKAFMLELRGKPFHQHRQTGPVYPLELRGLSSILYKRKEMKTYHVCRQQYARWC